ncbi:T9SS C-terminal target domain-containing protein [bacterium]|nr:MAG: T9SS C-terminal target domain-containing protein [bacterium]
MKNIIKTKKLLTICSFGIFLLISFSVDAKSSRDFQIPASVFSGGGGNRISSNYQQFDVFGEPVAGLRTSASYEENDGFIYHIDEQPPPDIIYVSINDAAANAGDTFLYPIYVSDTNVEPLVEGYEFTLTYEDTLVITTTGNYETDGTLSEGWLVYVNNTGSNEIIIGACSSGYLTGEGILIYVEFKVQTYAQPGDICQLEITEFVFNEGNPVADLSGATATFTVIPDGNYISGNISYCFDSSIPVPDITVELLPSTYLTTTISNGDYNFYDIPNGTYEITPYYDDLNINGINLIDYGKVKRHILGLEIIIPGSCQWMAADVNGDGNINAIDYGKIKQRILGYITEFPIGNWLFDPDSIEIELTSNLTGQDFVGIKVGDVNGDWSPSDMGKGVSSNNYNNTQNNSTKSITFTIEDAQCNLGEDVSVEVTTGNFKGAAVELHIVFDDSKLTYNNFTSSYLAGPDVNVVGNQVNIFKDFGSSQNITDTFVSLNFTVSTCETTYLNFQNCIVLDEFYNPIPDVTYNDGVIYPGNSVYESDEIQVAFLTNSPNPFKYTTSIIYYIPQPHNVKIRIYNIKGSLIETLVDEYKTTGTHSVNWDASHFNSGVYFCNILSGKSTITKKLLLIK